MLQYVIIHLLIIFWMHRQDILGLTSFWFLLLLLPQEKPGLMLPDEILLTRLLYFWLVSRYVLSCGKLYTRQLASLDTLEGEIMMHRMINNNKPTCKTVFAISSIHSVFLGSKTFLGRHVWPPLSHSVLTRSVPSFRTACIMRWQIHTLLLFLSYLGPTQVGIMINHCQSLSSNHPLKSRIMQSNILVRIIPKEPTHTHKLCLHTCCPDCSDFPEALCDEIQSFC